MELDDRQNVLDEIEMKSLTEEQIDELFRSDDGVPWTPEQYEFYNKQAEREVWRPGPEMLKAWEQLVNGKAIKGIKKKRKKKIREENLAKRQESETKKVLGRQDENLECVKKKPPDIHKKKGKSSRSRLRRIVNVLYCLFVKKDSTDNARNLLTEDKKSCKSDFPQHLLSFKDVLYSLLRVQERIDQMIVEVKGDAVRENIKQLAHEVVRSGDSNMKVFPQAQACGALGGVSR